MSDIPERSRHALYTAEELRSRGFAMIDPPVSVLSYDPAGDGADHDGIVIVSREEHRRGELYDPDMAVEVVYRLLMAKYLPRELEFQDKAATILSLHRSMASWTNKGKMAGHVVLVETNGIGWSMHSFLKGKIGRRVRGYTTVANVSAKPFQESGMSMPRLAALDNLRMLIDLQRFKSAKNAPGADLLVRELNSFVWKGPKRPEAIDGQHDDLVLPTAAACWFGTKTIPMITKSQRVTPQGVGAKTTGSGRFRVN